MNNWDCVINLLKVKMWHKHSRFVHAELIVNGIQQHNELSDRKIIMTIDCYE